MIPITADKFINYLYLWLIKIKFSKYGINEKS